ncbi:FAD-dependent oxidoreductase [Chloroflexota bacterium]
MTLRPLKHLNATSIEQVASMLAKHKGKAELIAGGTDLLGTLKDNTLPEYPEALINIKSIPGLEYINKDEEGLKIGALTHLSDVEESKLIKDQYSVLAEAARSVASPQIRNMGTIGGNICQQPRCWYYRNPENMFYCLRKTGKTCNALTGDNRYHSIFGAAKVSPTPCSTKCPGEVDIPAYFSKIREGTLHEAAEILLNHNPMPAITGRVCPHICEEECNRCEFDEAVSIRAVERFMGDYILENSSKLIENPEAETEKTVAIVGSGPAGLSAAYYLRKLGHKVTIFDRMEEPGGMLTYSIPSYRLPKNVVRRQIRMLKNIGIEFKLKVDVGTDITLANLRGSFDSVFIGTGAWCDSALGIKGEELLIPGLDFLIRVNQGLREAPGKVVLVIGGGGVAVDVATTALRLGAQEVIMVCLECRDEMPAIPWEIEQAVNEGVKLMPSWGPSRILKSSGKISGMELHKCTSVFDDEGRFCPTFDHNTTEVVKADQIMLAIGQKTDLSFTEPSLKVERGLITIDQNNQSTNIDGVFAGGDVTGGAASIIEAIAGGRRAAESINIYLGGQRGKIRSGKEEVTQDILKFNSDCLEPTDRAKLPILPISERSIDKEDFLCLDLDMIKAEATRCFNCGCVAVNASDIGVALVALSAKIRTTKRVINAEEFFSAEPMKSTTLDINELVTEIQIPQQPHIKQSFIKFRIRNSLDFPIVSLATVLHLSSDRINDARMVLGAVAPMPLRVRKAEDFLIGKTLREEVAEEAGAIAVQGSIPLAKNKYKIQIIKALVRKAILAARNS